jgi:hypothetical protein
MANDALVPQEPLEACSLDKQKKRSFRFRPRTYAYEFTTMHVYNVNYIQNPHREFEHIKNQMLEHRTVNIDLFAVYVVYEMYEVFVTCVINVM